MSAEIRFGDLFAVPLRNGVSYPSRQRGSGIPMVNMKEIFAFDRIADEECELAPLTEAERATCLLASGDLLFARQSLTFEGAGKCSLVLPAKSERTFESHLMRVRLAPEIAHAPFYYYYFRSVQGRRTIETIVQQVAAAGIRGSDLAKLKVPFPPLPEQRAIAEVLGALDDKISANTKLAATSTYLLDAQFEQLGVNCEPEDDSQIASLDELVELNPKVAAPKEEEPIYVDMQKLPTAGVSISGWERRPAKGGARFMNDDTLLARITPCLENRKTGYVDFLQDGQVAIGSTEFIVMRSRPGIPKQLSYFLATSERFRTYAIRHMIGTSGRQRVSALDLAGYTVSNPDPAALARFGEISTVHFKLLKSLTDENRTLATTRDALLPQLMSGKLRVKDAEKVLENAGV